MTPERRQSAAVAAQKCHQEIFMTVGSQKTQRLCAGLLIGFLSGDMR